MLDERRLRPDSVGVSTRIEARQSVSGYNQRRLTKPKVDKIGETVTEGRKQNQLCKSCKKRSVKENEEI